MKFATVCKVERTHYWQFFRASGSCVMERLSGSNTTTVPHLQATETESNSVTESIDHFAEQYSQSSSQTQNHANSDHTFHPISASEGLQVNNWFQLFKTEIFTKSAFLRL